MIVTTSLLGRALLAGLFCLACILMQLLSNGPRFVQLVVFVVSPCSRIFYLFFLTLGDSTFPLTCATSHCGRSLLCVSQSEMLNASLISSFYSTGFNNFQFYLTGFNNFQFLFDWFQQFPVLFDWFQHYPVL